MHRKFHEKFVEMLDAEAPFVVATVINVRGSAVAKAGARAILDQQGRPVFGWEGGGCVEAFVCAEARGALADGRTRVVTADLEDELSGVGLPCGGVMEIFIEPVMPRRRVLITGALSLALEVAALAERAGFAVTLEASSTRTSREKESIKIDVDSSLAGLDLGGDSVGERALSIVAELLAVTRGASCRPLQEVKLGGEVISDETKGERASEHNLVIVGHSQITEELAWLADRLGLKVFVDSASASSGSYPEQAHIISDDADFSLLPASAQASVVVATHHKGDHLAIERGLRAGARYVGLVASAHRSKLVREMLTESLHAHALSLLRTPAGLDLGATTPAEIALSIMSEVLASYHGRTGKPRSRLLQPARP